ncbi:hypothetical protein [Listeria cornellensis]|uniref:Uncharacterized protein n=1 Tax=Listeria cornellensis FSL F6-0969 TaxID=1265820 RepID=W7BUD6_9LIST|nr:hypothetical protein [Listeria cornellensis]EUJ26901.1 hypothetical protein PCORN_13945 [Listeria cornellensis FSL F6-0969]
MIDFQKEIQQLDQDIKKALAEGSKAIADNLTGMKTEFEKQLQRTQLYQELYRDAESIAEEGKQLLHKGMDKFEILGYEGQRLNDKLRYSFESHAGVMVASEFGEKRKKVQEFLKDDYEAVASSCRANML